MLKTLDKYIETQAEDRSVAASLWKRAARDRRFNYLLIASIIGHIAFYVAIIVFNYWAMKQIKPARRAETVLVEIARLPLDSDADEVRPAPESLERADINRLEFDPNNPDDTHLISRSPSPTVERGSGGQVPSVREIESHLRASGNSTGSGQNAPAPAQSARTPSVPAPLASIPQPDISASAPAATLPASPSPSASPNTPLPATGTPPPVPAGSRRGESNETRALGLQEVRARYEALIREKIRRENEASMPRLREWVRDMLDRRESVVFDLTIARGGRIQSLRLIKPSGYRLLDDRAREAIYIASPFEGYPQNAGDTIQLTVTVHYYPLP